VRIARRHQKRWFQADEVAAIYNADFSSTLASGGPCLIIVILRGIQDDLGRTLVLTKFLLYTLRVPRTIADLFWLSIQGTVTVLFASEKVCPCEGTFRAVGWLRFRELCPSGELWEEARKRPAVHFTLPFLRFPEYVRELVHFRIGPLI
jgi:hypothetical protein